MSKRVLFEDVDRMISFDETEEKKQAVYEAVLNYYEKYKRFLGEEIMQDDNAQIYAPYILSNISDDILKFEFENKE